MSKSRREPWNRMRILAEGKRKNDVAGRMFEEINLHTHHQCRPGRGPASGLRTRSKSAFPRERDPRSPDKYIPVGQVRTSWAFIMVKATPQL